VYLCVVFFLLSPRPLQSIWLSGILIAIMVEWLLMGGGGGLQSQHVSNPDSCPLSYFPGLMEIRSVSVGVVAIKSVSTGLYLAMSKKGTLFGSVRIHNPGNIGSAGQEGGGGRYACRGVPDECLYPVEGVQR